MRPPCEVIVRYVLPAYRALVAKTLIESYGFSQVASAKRLGTTQAAISYYLYSKRGDKVISQLEAVPGIRASVDKLAESIKEGRFSPGEALVMFCELCGLLKGSEFLCGLHRDSTELPPECNICLRPHFRGHSSVES